MDSNDPSIPRFLRLPLELRKLIYSYLLPNVTIKAGKRQRVIRDYLLPDVIVSDPVDPREPLREDGKSGAGLLRVNHQIYNELYHDWYRSTTFELLVCKDRVEFLNKCVQPGVSMHMPSALKAVETLHIKMVFWKAERTYDMEAEDWEAGTPEVIWVLGQLLSSGECALKHLHITLDVESSTGGLNYVHEITIDQSECYLLGKALEPLQNIRGLSKARIVVLNPYTDNRPTAIVTRIYNTFIERSKKYLDELEKKMMMPVISEGVSEDVSSADTGSLA
jgi:hypothetical protein